MEDPISIFTEREHILLNQLECDFLTIMRFPYLLHQLILGENGAKKLIKPDARILDATASYRSMWKTKESDKVLWIDFNEELDTPPDMIQDCRLTPFPTGRFHTIFFDPPHSYGHTKNTGVHQTPSRKIQKEKWGNTGSYYGFDCYPDKEQLMRFIRSSQHEFQRILSDDGILWFKWGEVRITVDEILQIFPNWDVMMKIETIYRGKRSGSRCYWFNLMKKPNMRQETL